MNYADDARPIVARKMDRPVRARTAAAPHSGVDTLAPTIFHQPWWLEIATRGRYAVVESKHNGRIVGRMPYCLAGRLGASCMPMLTPVLGPAADDGEGSQNARWLRRQTITQALLVQLPQSALFRQKLHRGISDVLAFQAEGYDSSVQFTLEIAPQPEEAIRDAMNDATRTTVREAEDRLSCDVIDDPDLFVRFCADNRSAANDADLAVGKDLIAASLARGCGRIIAARRSDGRIAAAAFGVWDSMSCYHLLAAGDDGPRALLLWNAMRDAARRGLIFQFDGGTTADAVLFHAGFGAAITPRYVVGKAARHRRLLMAARLLVARGQSGLS